MHTPILKSENIPCQDLAEHVSTTTYVTSHNNMYLKSIFDKYEMFAISKREINKLSNDTKLLRIEVLLLKIYVT